MPKPRPYRTHLSHLVEVTLRCTRYLPPRLREAAYWWLFRTPFLHSRTPEQLAILASARPFLVPSGRYLLRGYRYPGNGPTVILTHGWQGSAASWFRLVPLLLEAGYSVVTFDAPGHSGKPRYATLPTYAQGLRDVVELFSPVYALVGHSFGGMASAKVAQELPSLRALVLLGTPDKTRSFLESFAHRTGMSYESLQQLETRMQNELASPIDEATTSLYVSRVSCPSLVIHDTDDEIIPLEAAYAIAEGAKSSPLVTQGLGHRAIIKDSAVLEKVIAFLQNPITEL